MDTAQFIYFGLTLLALLVLFLGVHIRILNMEVRLNDLYLRVEGRPVPGHDNDE